MRNDFRGHGMSRRSVLGTLAAAWLFGLGSIFARSKSALAASPIRDNYDRQWRAMLSQIPLGEPLERARKRLPGFVKLVGFEPLGGTGRVQWIFGIDDFTELVIAVDRDSKVDQQVVIQPRKKWLRFPDGTIAELDHG